MYLAGELLLQVLDELDMARALVGAEALRAGGYLRPGQWDLRLESGGLGVEDACAQVRGPEGGG